MTKPATAQSLLRQEIRLALHPALKGSGFRDMGQGQWLRDESDPPGIQTLSLTDRVGTGHYCLLLTVKGDGAAPSGGHQDFTLFYAPLAPFPDHALWLQTLLDWPARRGLPLWLCRGFWLVTLPLQLVAMVLGLLLALPLQLQGAKWLTSAEALSGARQKTLVKRAIRALQRQFPPK
ncbi:hypothetical protein HOY34_17125 [Xinfangfangia sp. D13-10-4-6]|uniref:hypothetical protein n=1 Tax=Pseudogemmobacter hezensis TaxID=2737662 RepID=UPI0015523C4A|nr:hypothetical protein [Pseudogemmobacter hezensis]NPD16918.1 hypothetical protein [Pseudogemmobacter hezensis]